MALVTGPAASDSGPLALRVRVRLAARAASAGGSQFAGPGGGPAAAAAAADSDLDSGSELSPGVEGYGPLTSDLRPGRLGPVLTDGHESRFCPARPPVLPRWLSTVTPSTVTAAIVKVRTSRTGTGKNVVLQSGLYEPVRRRSESTVRRVRDNPPGSVSTSLTLRAWSRPPSRAERLCVSFQRSCFRLKPIAQQSHRRSLCRGAIHLGHHSPV